MFVCVDSIVQAVCENLVMNLTQIATEIKITVSYSWKCPLSHIKNRPKSEWWKVSKNHFKGEENGLISLYKLTIYQKTFYFFILFRYAIWTISTSLIPNMKSVFSYHLPFPSYGAPQRSNFDFFAKLIQLNDG